MDGEAGIATASWAHPSWATPHHGARRERKPEKSHTQPRVGSREESVPPSTWTESGRTSVLPESSSSRDRPPPRPLAATAVSTCSLGRAHRSVPLGARPPSADPTAERAPSPTHGAAHARYSDTLCRRPGERRGLHGCYPEDTPGETPYHPGLSDMGGITLTCESVDVPRRRPIFTGTGLLTLGTGWELLGNVGPFTFAGRASRKAVSPWECSVELLI